MALAQIWLAVLLLACSCVRSVVAEPKVTDEARAEVVSFLASAEKIQRDQYGNVHIRMRHETSFLGGINGDTHTSCIEEYWARENRFFRLDVTTTESTDQNPVRRRSYLVRPKGSVCLKTMPGSDKLVPCDKGGPEVALDYIFGSFGVSSSIRYGVIRFALIDIATLVGMEPDHGVPSLPKYAHVEKNQLQSVELTEGGKHLLVKWAKRQAPSTTERSLLLDPVRGVVLEYKTRGLERERVSYIAWQTHKYDSPDYRDIARESIFTTHSTELGAASRIETFKITKIDWSPPPLEVLARESFGGGPDGQD